MIRSILATLLCLLVVTPAGMAQQPLAEPQVGSISGVTLDSGGQPVRGARLVLTRLESRAEWDTRSGAGGVFGLRNSSPGATDFRLNTRPTCHNNTDKRHRIGQPRLSTSL